ncbi:MAG: DNA-processing protein DprA [Syntrophobacteraceae bacterium]|nr:DNA-processing protein DprA [Syntrophobacteraceae bacterium]
MKDSNSRSPSTGWEKNRISWLSLKLVPGLGNKSILRLLQLFGSPENVVAADLKDLLEAGTRRDEPLRMLAQKRFVRDPEKEWQYLRSKNFHLLCQGDEDYPANLAEISDPPAVLFVSGPLLARDLVSIAVVGSRYASPSGILFAERLSSDLASCGVTIVSGFALGIDSAAHRGALRVKGRTVAVLGSGLDVNYPSINADLRREIGQDGALVTESILGAPPLSGNFPARNRIISGLSLGVVVVEAAERSGSLITARLALEQGREVFAVPGVARSARSKGAHRLIRQGAKLVESAEDVLEEIRPLLRQFPSGSPAPSDKGNELKSPNSSEQTILLKILDGVVKHIDEIAAEVNFSIQKTAALLLELELKGLVCQLPGKYFTAHPQT